MRPLLHNEVRLLDAIEIVALLAHGLYVFGNEFAFEYVTFELNDIADIDLIGAAYALRVYVNIGAGAVFEKTIAFGSIEPLHSCAHSF